MANYGRTQSLMTNKIEVLINNLVDKISDPNLSEEEIAIIISDTINNYFYTAITHSFIKRKISKSSALIVKDIDNTFEEIDMDLQVLYKEVATIANDIVTNFNYGTAQKKSLLSSIKELGSILSEYSLITQGLDKNTVVISDNFNTENNIDKEFGSGSNAFIHVNTGIATLEHKNSNNISGESSIYKIVGNGTPGNYHTIITNNVADLSGSVSSNSMFLSEKDAHDKEFNILDKMPSTWYEYQMIGISETNYSKHSSYTDLSWVNGNKIGDKLRAKITIDLKAAQSINWININPYMPTGSSNKLTVYSISTSVDGLVYSPIYTEEVILNAKLNAFPNTFDPNYMASDSLATSKFTSQGVWNFPAREAKYIEIVLDQEESYPIKVGIPVYMRTTETQVYGGRRKGYYTSTEKIRISEKDVPTEIRSAVAGKYNTSSTSYIEKTIEEVDGWRYCVGIKDINIYKYSFMPQSELVSKLYTFEKAIKTVSLATKEIIPVEVASAIATRNDWIKYYISINDVEWYQISPSSHYQIGSTEIPPKVYTINRTDKITTNLNTGSIAVKDPVYQIRFKAVFVRGDLEYNTPILEDYNLSISIED